MNKLKVFQGIEKCYMQQQTAKSKPQYSKFKDKAK